MMVVAVGMAVAMIVAVVMAVIVVMVMVMVIVVVVLAHASVPVEGSAICSSISLSTPLIWASAAE